jgi:hypothetical protein
MKITRSGSAYIFILLMTVAVALPQETVQKPAADPELVVPAGTVFPVVLNSYLSTKNTQVGDIFYADTTYPIWIQQRLIIPRGSILKGTVTEVSRPGAIKGKGRIAVKFETILLPNGVERPLIADFRGIHGPGSERLDRKSESVEKGGSSNTGTDLGRVVGTAGQGAIIGSVASRTGTGAGIGAGAGAAAGLAIVLLSRDRNVLLEPGTQFDLELRMPLKFAYGEVMFTRDEMDKAERSAVVRPASQVRPKKSVSPFPLPRIRR